MSRNNRLQVLLTKQLIAKHDCANDNERKRIIVSSVREFFTNRKNLSQFDLQHLENEVNGALSSLCNQRSLSSVKVVCSDSNDSMAVEFKRESSNLSKRNFENLKESPSDVLRSVEVNWRILDAVKEIEKEQAISNEIFVAGRKKTQLKSGLEEQIKQRKEQEVVNKSQYEKDCDRLRMSLEHSNAEAMRQRQLRKLEQESLSDIRTSQVEEFRRQKEEQKRKETAEGIEEALRVEAARVKEENDNLAKRTKSKNILNAMRDENTKLKHEQETRVKDEAIRDQLMIEQERLRQEAEEERRRIEFNNRVATLNKFGRKWESEGAGRVAAEEEVRYSQKIERDLQTMNALQSSKELEKSLFLKRSHLTVCRENHEKAQEVERARQVENDMKRSNEREEQAKIQEDMLHQNQRHAEVIGSKQRAYKKALEDQMEERRRKDDTIEMTLTEKAINKSLLSRVLADDSMQRKLSEKYLK